MVSVVLQTMIKSLISSVFDRKFNGLYSNVVAKAHQRPTADTGNQVIIYVKPMKNTHKKGEGRPLLSHRQPPRKGRLHS